MISQIFVDYLSIATNYFPAAFEPEAGSTGEPFTMSARERWSRRADAWRAARAPSSPATVVHESEPRPAPGSPGWSSGSARERPAVAHADIDLLRKEVEVLQFIDQNLELQQQLLARQEAWDREREEFHSRESWLEGECRRRQVAESRLKTALATQTGLLEESEGEMAHLTSRIGALEEEIARYDRKLTQLAGEDGGRAADLTERLRLAEAKGKKFYRAAAYWKVKHDALVGQAEEFATLERGLRTGIDQATAELDGIRQAQRQQGEELSAKETVITDLRDALAKVRRDRQEAARAGKEMEAAHEEELSRRDREMAHLREVIHRREAEVGELQEHISGLEAHLKRAGEEDADAGETPMTKSKEIARLSEEIASLEGQLHAGEPRPLELEPNLRAVHAGADLRAEAIEREWEQAMQNLEEELERRQAAVEDRDHQVDTLQNELAGFSSLLEEKEARISKLQDHLDQVQSGNRDREATLKRALAEKADLLTGREAQIKALQAQSHRLQLRLGELHGVKPPQAGEGSGREPLNVVLDEMRDPGTQRRHEHLTQVRQELRRANRQLEERGRELAALRRRVDLSKVTETGAVSQVGRAKQELASIQTQVADKDRQIEQLSSLIQRERGNVARRDETRHQRETRLQIALKDRERDLKRREAENEKLREQLESMRAELRLSEARSQPERGAQKSDGAFKLAALASQLARAEEAAKRWKQQCKHLQEKADQYPDPVGR